MLVLVEDRQPGPFSRGSWGAVGSASRMNKMNKPLRILVVSLHYPPLAGGGYGVMAGQVCAWLRRQGHALLVLAAGDPVARTGRTAPAAVDGVPVRWTLHSYWDGEDCRYPPFREALAIEQANHAQLQQALADLHPDVVTSGIIIAEDLGVIGSRSRCH